MRPKGWPPIVDPSLAQRKRRSNLRVVLYIVAAVVVLAVIGSLTSSPQAELGATATGSTSPAPQASATPAATSSAPLAFATPASATPTVIPTTEPESSTAPAFDPISLKGRGDKVAKISLPGGIPAIAAITNKGSSNFIVETLDATGGQLELLVNEIGSYAGTHLFDVFENQHTAAFRIESNGTWTIAVKPFLEARVWDGSAAVKGTGADVLLLSPPSAGLSTVRIKHLGDSNFAVQAFGPDGVELLVNEIGNYEGEQLLPDGTVVISIEADGRWSLTPG